MGGVWTWQEERQEVSKSFMIGSIDDDDYIFLLVIAFVLVDR
jgi:hypothetical protein